MVAIAERIAEDGTQVLVDLMGHTRASELLVGVHALKPAIIQAVRTCDGARARVRACVFVRVCVRVCVVCVYVQLDDPARVCLFVCGGVASDTHTRARARAHTHTHRHTLVTRCTWDLPRRWATPPSMRP